MIIPTKDFQRAVALGTACAEQGQAIPILRCALLEAQEGALSVASTNLGVATRRATAIVDPGASWAACVPAHLLAGVAKVVDADEVELELVEDHLVITSGGQWRIATHSRDNFPTLPKYGGWKGELVIDATAFRDAWKRVESFIQKKTNQFEIAAAYLGSDETGVHLVSCDGNALAVVEIPSLSEGLVSGGVLITPQAAKVSQLIGHGPMSVYDQENSVALSVDEAWVWQRKIEREFWPWRKVIPSERTLTDGFTVEGDILAGMLKKLTGLESGDPITIKATGGELILSSSSVALKSTVTDECEIIGDGIDTCIAKRYLDGAMAAAEAKKITVRGPGDKKQIMFESERGMAVVMPRAKGD